MSDRAREVDRRTTTFFGFPGVGFFTLFVVVVLIGTGTIRVMGAPPYAVALFLAAVAVAIMFRGRVRRRS